jgi:hypothetical protein
MSVSPKYERTFHLPWSKGTTNDDKLSTSVDKLVGQMIVITEKIDGSNASLEKDGCFARTHASAPTHPSFDHLKAFHASIKHLIPSNLQLFGENCYAQHSIYYKALPAYFLLFNVRELRTTHPNKWLSWEDVNLWAEEIGVPTVPVLFFGMMSSEQQLQTLTEDLMNQPSNCGGIREGIVIRVADAFDDEEFAANVQKCVRANHVNTEDHWAFQTIVKNQLRIISGS